MTFDEHRKRSAPETSCKSSVIKIHANGLVVNMKG